MTLFRRFDADGNLIREESYDLDTGEVTVADETGAVSTSPAPPGVIAGLVEQRDRRDRRDRRSGHADRIRALRDTPRLNPQDAIDEILEILADLVDG